jgi:arylsulfatase A|tara:strand:+ start:2497 stop:3828 length:1332 start_codon:yes stop_codon:yes gene_type:complete
MIKYAYKMPLIILWILAMISFAESKSPNVVLIMADDLGYHDLSCYGHPSIKTPVIDKLAKEGVRLTSFYAGSTICTPSRMALLTGSYPSRLGWSKGVIGYIMKKGQGMSKGALTMAEIFKEQGYRTGMFGKWHLGDESQFLPHQQGFEESFYINKSNNQTKKLWRRDKLVQDPFNNRRLTEQFTNEAVSFIKTHKDNPFFLYVPYSAPHFPVQAHPDWKGKSEYGSYGDVVEEMDSRIGEILNALKIGGMEKDTIVVFLSDNGPEPLTKESKAKPLRGKKWSALEGGNRVPCVVRFPGKIPQGSETDALIAAIDLLPTLSHACSINLEASSEGKDLIDGMNLWKFLIGEGNIAESRKEFLYWHGSDGFQAIRMGKWKLFLNRGDAGMKGKGPALFNLEEDIAESVDLSKRFPDKVHSMHGMAKKHLASIKANSIPLGNSPANK